MADENVTPKEPEDEAIASLDDEDFEMQPKYVRPSQQVRKSGILRAIRDDDPRLADDAK